MNRSSIDSLWRPGDSVQLYGDVSARILAVLIEGEPDSPCVQYKVRWWNGRSREEGWVASHEIVPNSASKNLRIGFRHSSNS